jgi:hypothetical protein
MAEPGYVPPDQTLPRRIQAIEGRISQLERPTGSQNNRNKDKVQAALELLAEQVEALEGVTAELADVQASQQETIDYLASLTVSTAVGSTSQTSVSAGTWGSDRPALVFRTSTGKVRITVSASILSVALSTTGAATFSIDGQVTRDANITGITSGTFTGAVNAFATDVIASGSYVHTVEGLPVDTAMTARFECYAHAGNIGYAHPKIIVEVIP